MLVSSVSLRRQKNPYPVLLDSGPETWAASTSITISLNFMYGSPHMNQASPRAVTRYLPSAYSTDPRSHEPLSQPEEESLKSSLWGSGQGGSNAVVGKGAGVGIAAGKGNAVAAGS